MGIALKDMKLIQQALREKVLSLQHDPRRDENNYSDFKRLLDDFDELILRQ